MRLEHLYDVSRRSEFQFTHPGRGATSAGYSPADYMAGFNSRTPGGVRHLASGSRTSFPEFQFTHPGRGATATKRKAVTDDGVSIHAPREGCDKPQSLGGDDAGGFNSRTPGGVRQRVLHLPSEDPQFQFTHPGRGATPARRAYASLRRRFNSRTPGGVRLVGPYSPQTA